MVESSDSREAPEAALGRCGPPDEKPDIALAYHWSAYARRRERERREAIVALRTRMLARL